MQVILVYAGIGIAGFNPDRPKGDREGGWISHGIASIGASVKAAGFDVNLIDMRQLAGWQHFANVIKHNQADVYGLSIAPVDYATGLMAVYQIKTVNPKAKIIIGGIHPTVFPENYNYKVIDTVVKGEGEVTFVDLLHKIEKGEHLPRVIQGIKPDLDSIPWVDRESFDYQRELDCYFVPEQETPSITMLAGRGCPYHCNYCQPAENAVFGKPHRMRSPANVIGELQHLREKYHYNSVTFWDDTFTFNRKWVMDFCELYKNTMLDLSIVACSRSDIICNNEDMVERLADIGVKCLVIGMESGSQRILNLIKKGTTVEQNREAGRICKKYGIKVFATYMYGLPTETKEDAMATQAMINDISPEYPSPFWYVPIPGTGLHDYCVKNDLILDDMKGRTIERTGKFLPTIKGVDYRFLSGMMQEVRGI